MMRGYTLTEILIFLGVIVIMGVIGVIRITNYFLGWY